MLVLIITLVIAVISVLWAMLSLTHLQKTKEIESAQKDLSRGKVLFYDSSASKSSSSDLE